MSFRILSDRARSTLRFVVQASHLNSWPYLAHVRQTLPPLLLRLGLGPESIERALLLALGGLVVADLDDWAGARQGGVELQDGIDSDTRSPDIFLAKA